MCEEVDESIKKKKVPTTQHQKQDQDDAAADSEARLAVMSHSDCSCFVLAAP